MPSRRDKNRIPEIAAELPRGVDAAIARASILVMQQAKARVPVETGKLRNAIHVERTGNGEHMVIAGDRNVFYGHIVEHGGVNHAGHPFLIPALEDSRKEILKLVSDTLDSL